MQAWRITKKNRALDRSGFGASITGQRWNSVNVPAIYAGLTLEIAALEKLVHTGSILPLDLVIVQITLPDDSALFESPNPDTLPDGWDALPASSAAADYGDTSRLPGAIYLEKIGHDKHDLGGLLENTKRQVHADGYWVLHNHPSGAPRSAYVKSDSCCQVKWSYRWPEKHVMSLRRVIM